MVPFEEMRDRVLGAVPAPAATETDLAAAHGRVLAEDVRSAHEFPLFDNSAMDGFAVRSDDVSTTPARLKLLGVSSAGRPFDGVVGEGEAARILTGAQMVEGADCVVPVEETSGSTTDGFIEVTATAAPGAHIRRRGEVVRAGDVVAHVGTILNAGYLGALAALGVPTVSVLPVPSVAILSTGDELVGAGAVPSPGQIFESNVIVLEALLGAMGCDTEVIEAPDDVGALGETLDRLSGEVDIIISTGGVSMGGEYDALRNAARDFDVGSFQVAMKPAKPLAFGWVNGTLMFGLPGNPASALISFESFVRPAIRRFSGIEPAVPPTFAGVTAYDLGHPDDGKAHFVAMSQNSDGLWVSTAELRSHSVASLAASTAMTMLAPGQLLVPAGSQIELMPLWASLL